MKTKIMISLAILTLLNAEMAQVAHADDEYFCAGQCIVLDANQQYVEVLGNVTGTSTYQKDEAWADLNQNCQNLKTDKGYSGVAQVVHSLETFHKTQTSHTQETSTFYFRGHHTVRAGTSSYDQYDIDDKRSVHVEAVNPNTDCSEPAHAPHGKPKYVGSGHPMG